MGAKSIVLWLAAWLAAAALWMVLSDSIRPSELVVGAGVAAIAATGFELVRRQRVAAQAVMPQLSARALRVLPKLAPDILRLTRAAFVQLFDRRATRGEVLAMPFPHLEDDPRGRAYRAVASGLGSMAPNSLVVGVDRENGLIYVHQLDVTRKPSDLDPLKLR